MAVSARDLTPQFLERLDPIYKDSLRNKESLGYLDTFIELYPDLMYVLRERYVAQHDALKAKRDREHYVYREHAPRPRRRRSEYG